MIVRASHEPAESQQSSISLTLEYDEALGPHGRTIAIHGKGLRTSNSPQTSRNEISAPEDLRRLPATRSPLFSSLPPTVAP